MTYNRRISHLRDLLKKNKTHFTTNFNHEPENNYINHNMYLLTQYFALYLLTVMVNL